MDHDDDVNSARARELGMDREITRRDFLNGVAIGAGGVLGGALLPGAVPHLAAAQAAKGPQGAPGYYPPALTGMRGTHDGSYVVPHALRDGIFRITGAIDTNEAYDLVVVGGGISGLAAAYYYRAQAGPSARILVLDVLDDAGGHAKRNEFQVGGTLLITNGGTLGISSPFKFSKEALGLMQELGMDPPAMAAKAASLADRQVFQGLQSAYFFDKETFGVDRLVVGAPSGGRGRNGAAAGMTWAQFMAKTPLSAEAQRDIARLEEESVDYMPGLSPAQKEDKLSRMSYQDFLLTVVKVHPDVIPFYKNRTNGLYGVGIDAVPALDLFPGSPGFQGLNLKPGPTSRMSYTALGHETPNEPYSFHHPDGAASVARHLVRALIPAAVPGHTAEDIVTAVVDYGRLDTSDAPVRIRLNSTAVRVRHVGSPASAQEVEVTYSREAKLYTVRAKGVVMACWNAVIPHVCPELPDEQKAAMQYGVKVPLVYTAVAIRNWTAFKQLGIRGVSCPGMYHNGFSIEQPTVIGNYNPTPKSPSDPVVLRGTRTPCKPGLPAKDQHRAGHTELLATPFKTFELKIRDQLARSLKDGGFDPAREIAAITVNRWPHGYVYEYNPLWDPDWPDGRQPCQIARKPFGRITIANSDAGAAAYLDTAMDQAYRAVQELTGKA